MKIDIFIFGCCYNVSGLITKHFNNKKVSDMSVSGIYKASLFLCSALNPPFEATDNTEKHCLMRLSINKLGGKTNEGLYFILGW